jgi:hypothetical protein
LTNQAVLFAALKVLAKKGILDEMPDDFGPHIYKRTSSFENGCKKLKSKENTPWYRALLDPDPQDWLKSALERLNNELKSQNIVWDDFQDPDAEWEPLPVDRSNKKLQLATNKLDEAIAAIEENNGYNVKHPEEKAFVVDSLKVGAERLKKADHISYAYVKRQILDPLAVLTKRFGKSAVGVIAQAARSAVFDWLKDIGLNILHLLNGG